jgi:hypothetical protein
MRKVLLTVLSLLTLFATAQTPHAQDRKATVLRNNISIEEALALLSTNYGVTFSYSDDVVPMQTTVNLEIYDETLPSALDKLLKPLSIIYKITNSKRIVLRKAPAVLAQTIRGIVLDQVTHTPLVGATVIIQDSDPLIGASTDINGKFKIDHVPVGRINMVVSNIGYDPKQFNSILLSSGKELVVEAAMSESVTHINEIVITAPKHDGIPGEGIAVTSSKTFSVEETKRFAGSMGDPARMASAFAGITGGSDENNALVVRGNSPRGILWRVEGIEIPNPNHFTTEGSSSGIVSVLSPNMISNYDFLTGAFPAQYGNALSGVLDINLRNGNNEKREYSVQAGLSGLEFSTEGPFTKKNSSSYLINYRYSTLSVLDKLGTDLNDAGQYKDYQDLAFKINLPTKNIGSFSLFGFAGKSKARKNIPNNLDYNFSDVGVLGLTYKHMLNDQTFLQASLSYSGSEIYNLKKITRFELEGNYQKTFLRYTLTLRRKITNRYFVEAGAIICNLHHNFSLETISTDEVNYPVVVNFRDNDSDKNSTYTMQGFIHSRQYFSRKLFAFYGAHFLSFSLTKDYSLEPRAGLRWQMADDRSLSLAYGKHSRIENLQYYLARDHQTGGNEVQINKNLGFTRAHHIVLSFEKTLKTNHHVKMETYYQYLYNAPIQTDPTAAYAVLNEDSGFITDSLINKGKGKNYGMELSLEKTFSDNFYYLINGSVYNSSFTIPDQTERSTAYDGNYVFHLLGGKEFEIANKRNRLGVNLKITYAGGRRYVPIDLNESIKEQRQVNNWSEAYEHQMPDYFRADFQVVYKMNRPLYSFECRLDIQNITNHKNAAWYYYDIGAQRVKLKKQFGIIPLLSCRIDF